MKLYAVLLMSVLLSLPFASLFAQPVWAQFAPESAPPLREGRGGEARQYADENRNEAVPDDDADSPGMFSQRDEDDDRYGWYDWGWEDDRDGTSGFSDDDVDDDWQVAWGRR